MPRTPQPTIALASVSKGVQSETLSVRLFSGGHRDEDVAPSTLECGCWILQKQQQWDARPVHIWREL